MGTGEVNVARAAPSLEGLDRVHVRASCGRGDEVEAPLFPLSSLNSGTGASCFAADPRMLYLPGPGRIPGVTWASMKPFGRSGDICWAPLRRHAWRNGARGMNGDS